MLGVSWKGRVNDKEVRVELVSKAQRMKISNATIILGCSSIHHWICGPRANWRGSVKKDVQRMVVAWEEAEVLARRSGIGGCLNVWI